MNFAVPLSLAAYPLAVFLCYWCALRGPLIFDDYEIEPRLAKFKWKWAWIRSRQRPLSSLFLAIQSKWPNSLRALHGTNQILHFLCAFHVERIGRLIGFDDGLAFFAGLLFCVHPLASNGVGWITGRHSLLAAFFGLGAAHAVLAGLPWLAFPLLALAFWSKEDAAGYAVTVGALLLYKEEIFWFSAHAAACITGFILHWSLVKRLLANTGSEIMENIGLPGSLPQPWHALTTLAVTLARLPLWALGMGQAPYAGSGIRLRYHDFLLAAVTLGLLLFVPDVAFILILTGPWLVYLFCPLPDILMEHRNYSQTAGIALALAAQLDRGPWWIMALGLVAYASLTALKSAAYSSVIDYWTASANHASGDSSRAFQEMGAWMKVNNKDKEAEEYLCEALRLNPNLAPALNNLGWLLIQRGSKTKLENSNEINEGTLLAGAAHLEKCTKVALKFALGWQDYGIWLENTGKPEEAYACYRKALELDPGMVSAINRLGLCAFYSKDFTEACRLFTEAGKLNPRSLEYAYNTALALRYAGRTEEAQRIIQTLPQPCPVNQNMINASFAK